MNIFQLSICTVAFGITLLLGTTAVIASRFVITTVASLTRPAQVSESVVMPAAERETVVDLPDLRNEPRAAPENFDADGTFWLETEKLPTAFADVEYIEIATREEKDNPYISRPIIPKGTFQAKKSFVFTKISVGNREIAFETNTQDGVSYQFVGDFPVSGESIDCEACVYPADLSGVLKKLKNGKVIAELDAKFYYGGC